jgi:hypothetical protein
VFYGLQEKAQSQEDRNLILPPPPLDEESNEHRILSVLEKEHFQFCLYHIQ